jgi:hypothetical protein
MGQAAASRVAAGRPPTRDTLLHAPAAMPPDRPGPPPNPAPPPAPPADRHEGLQQGVSLVAKLLWDVDLPAGGSDEEFAWALARALLPVVKRHAAAAPAPDRGQEPWEVLLPRLREERHDGRGGRPTTVSPARPA